jgi:hypothetical protein
MKTKNKILVSVHPNADNTIVTDGWGVSDSASIAVTNKGIAYCLVFDPIPRLTVYKAKENGDYGVCLQSIPLDEESLTKMFE